jgi:hypothetical protein
MGVLPSKRRSGVASSMMSWGLQKAEELDLECFLEASLLGKRLYERFDFIALMSMVVNTDKKNPSQTWTRLQSQYSPITVTLMWRPRPSDIHAGTVKSFWDVLKDYKRP